jgi:hypothetical protein
MFETKKKRRERFRRTPLSAARRAILERNVPYYRFLPADDRAELEGLVQIFLSEKRFEGCDGLEMRDEIRLTIAAHACVLLLHRDTEIYPLLQSVLVYPHTFVAPLEERAPGGIVIEDFEEREGESWDTGALILSWDDVLESIANPHDGYNVVFHEFAHQLDDEAGIADGAPKLKKRSMYDAWSRVFAAEYQALAENIERHRPTVLDEYGAESPAEFFAVATEAFFGVPAELKKRHPALYEQLRLFYEQDPAALVTLR